jgi:hypothetical protein
MALVWVQMTYPLTFFTLDYSHVVILGKRSWTGSTNRHMPH